MTYRSGNVVKNYIKNTDKTNDISEWECSQELVHFTRLVVLDGRQSEDWTRKGVQIVRWRRFDCGLWEGGLIEVL